MILSFELAIGFGSYCFRPFQVSDSIQDELDGDPLNLILFPLGYMCLGLLALSCTCWLITEIYFRQVRSKAVRADRICPVELADTNLALQ
mmetsp:Transcript_10737/g.34277  ORF Transcript_10737/g.34277 Transcript_10737/m.34277 type:complete len:90 (-) Transcript_10737:141-410(-)